MVKELKTKIFDWILEKVFFWAMGAADKEETIPFNSVVVEHWEQ